MHLFNTDTVWSAPTPLFHSDGGCSALDHVSVSSTYSATPKVQSHVSLKLLLRCIDLSLQELFFPPRCRNTGLSQKKASNYLTIRPE